MECRRCQRAAEGSGCTIVCAHICCLLWSVLCIDLDVCDAYFAPSMFSSRCLVKTLLNVVTDKNLLLYVPTTLGFYGHLPPSFPSQRQAIRYSGPFRTNNPPSHSADGAFGISLHTANRSFVRSLPLAPGHRPCHLVSSSLTIYATFLTCERALTVISYNMSLNANKNAAVMTDCETLGTIPVQTHH